MFLIETPFAIKENKMRDSFFVRQFRIGFFAPIDSLKFLFKNKTLLFIGLAPHVVGMVAYFWALKDAIIPRIMQRLIEAGLIGPVENSITTYNLALYSAYIIGLLLYALIGLPLVTLCANPVFDFVAGATFERTTQTKLPPSSIKLTFQSLFSELVKLIILYSLILSSFWVFYGAPLIFLVSIWYLGWDFMDRTLTLKQLPLHKRFFYGIKHAIACCMLGLWIYIPFAGSLLAFVMASAGAIAVSQLSPQKILPQEKI